MISLRFSTLIGTLLVSLGTTRASSVNVTNLQCEYRVEPLGLDTARPRLSWQLAAIDRDKRGQRQTRYQILVASSLQLLEENEGDRWDSGCIQSDESVNINYSGKPLRSGDECYWKVRVADESGELSNWSSTRRWTMGQMSPSDWKALWIGVDQATERRRLALPARTVLPDPWLRKSFRLQATPARAVIYVASVGYHELYINGQKVGNAVLEPCATDNRIRARYVTYEIGDRLKPGPNVLALWLGTSWSIFPPYATEDKPQGPIVLAQADIFFKDGPQAQIVTDETWKTHASPNWLLGLWSDRDYGGELYDSRAEMPDWCKVDCDESLWNPSVVFHPRLAVSSETSEPNRLVKEIKPVAIKEVEKGVYCVDMGINFAGWLECQVAGQPGDRIRFEFSERKEVAMTHKMRAAYVIGASGKGTFRNHFNYEVGRWIRISGLRHEPAADEIRGWLVRTDYARAGAFECDQPLLNRIYNTTLWTFENLSLGGYVVDCPQRERMGYGGDAHSTTRTALDNYHLGAFYTKWIEDWRDVQETNGSLPYTAPTYWGGGGPPWSGFCITLPWELYRHYGDIRILEENFAMMRRWLAFLETKAEKDMLVRWGGKWDFLGDWLWPGASGVNGDTRETLFFN
ncbi:Alpha-L-rhamnosidase protein (fragment) [Verrucomicrobia bacterium]